MMDILAIQGLEKRPDSDVLAIPFFQDGEKVVFALQSQPLKKTLKVPLNTGDFKGKEGEILWIYTEGKEQRIALLGLGKKKKVTVEGLRRAYSSLAKGCLSRQLKKLTLLMPELLSLTEKEQIEGIAEGLLLTNYNFVGLKKSIKEKLSLIQKVYCIDLSSKGLAIAKRCAQVCEGVYLARNLVNGNADDITAQFLSEQAMGIAKKYPKTRATVFKKKRLEKEGFGLLLAVGRASRNDPALILLEYKGNPKSKEHVVLVGKGITYDTGGLNLKPTGSMETMRSDMAGAAVVLGVLQVIAALKLKRNVTVVIPTAENCIDANSYKPGDVYVGYAGKSVEIGNTDAEGRLVLADALAYAVRHLNPTYIIDLATLTGAMDIALGSEYIGVFSNHAQLVDLLCNSSESTYERCWQLPLVEEYREQLKSDIADLKNIGGRGAGSIKGALFLEEFVNGCPWAHLDIASVAYSAESKRYIPKYGTGIGVRLLVDFIHKL